MRRRACSKFAVLAVMVLAMTMIIGTMSVFAYDYEMTVSGGNGTINGSTEGVTSVEPVTDEPFSNKIKINDEEVTVTPPSDKHFVIGVKDTGHDNKEIIDGKVTLDGRDEDVSLVVAYGLKSNMVEYTVNYYIEGTTTTPPGLARETHYGVIGSKPVVSAKFADGYVPANALSITGTLSADPSQNNFDFTYYEVDQEGNVITIVDGNVVVVVPAGGAGAGAGAAGAGAAGAGAAAAGDGAAIGDGAVPLAEGPAEIVDLDDAQTPLAEGEDAEIEEGETPKEGGISGGAIAGGAILVAAVAAAAVALAKRRGAGEDDDDDDEE